MACPKYRSLVLYNWTIPLRKKYARVDVIDLTGDDKDDLQRAIALSLEESNRTFRETGITDEEQAISRVLEASIAENKASLKRTHTEVWSDSPNPYDRKRQDNCPVGLKNVGNTCWFSAVIQEHRNLPFMRELRYLFSLLVSSKRKYVDPSRAVEILKDAFKSNDSQQVSTPVLNYDTLTKGKKFENTEMFGQYPLQVNGFKDLHECLEAAMIEGEIESLHSENCSKSGQEHWFTELPPVLTFELSRFEFNQALGRPEKIHNKLEFPPCLYMDRYMHKNREITRLKRDEIKRLKEHLTVLQQRLERYLSYGSGPKRFPLADVLQYALEFASSKPVCTSPVEDIDTSAPPSGSVVTQPMQSSTMEHQGSSSSGETQGSQRTIIHKPFTQSRIPPDLPMHPAPRNITDEELTVLEGCLHRWRTEVPYRLHAVLVHEGQANAGHYWAYIFDHNEKRWMKYNDISVTKSSWEELERDSFGGYRNASAYCLMYINDGEQHLIQEEYDKETGQVLAGMDTLPPDLKEFVKEDNRRFDKELEEWDKEQLRKAEQEKMLLAQKTLKPTLSAAPAPVKDPEYMEQPTRAELSTETNDETTSAISQAVTESEDKGPEAVLQTPTDNTPVPAAPSQRVVEVAIPHIGTFVIESEEGGYDDEAIKTEYARLLKLAQEDPPPETDYRLQHAIVYFIQSQAPKKIIERTLLEQFADRNLSFDERFVDALLYLIYGYQYNKDLLSRGLYRGHDEELIAHYRRECFLKLNEKAAIMFESGDTEEVTNGLTLMNELIVPCLPMLLADEMEEKDIIAVEDMRNRWCSYLGQEMEPCLQEKLTDFLPKLLDCSTEIKGFNDPPKLPTFSTHELCERFARIMLSLSRTPADGR
ncbi:hypothetical protein GDO78_008964 [Eleutherodactylus coqui]|uniref:Ubiquitin carboxyl-terminal hydrolase n=1 Tax=Eleutherodactylus coqui TaxID=57060 RepID=A0A8J6FEQ7_ELECQ|nr:hypothetical protein GDO78_008964 [Eleutherodactylus coqui]